MAIVLPQLFWGATLENQLDCGWPLEAPVTYPVPRAPSEVMQAADASAEDGWYVGTDYILEADFRYVPAASQPALLATGHSAPNGMDALLSWARQRGKVRFVPDRAAPGNYVDGYVVEPWNGPPGIEPLDGSQRYHLKFRSQQRSYSEALRGLLFEYTPGMSLADPRVATFSRSGAVGPFVGVAGLAGNALANVLRDSHYPLLPQGAAIRTTLLEAGGTNLIENGDYEADVVGVTVQDANTVVRDNANVFSGSWAAKCTYNGTLANSGFIFTPRAGGRTTVVAGTTYTFSAWVFASSAAAFNSVGRPWELQFEWYNAGGGVISNPVSPVVNLVAGWQRLTFTATAPALTTTALFYLTVNGTPVSNVIWIDDVQVEASLFATSAIPTGVGTGTRNADVFKYATSIRNQGLAVYARWVELGTFAGTTTRYIWGIDKDGAGAAPRLALINESGTAPRVYYSPDGDVTSRRATGNIVPALNDDVEVLVQLRADGAVNLSEVVNGGAEFSAGFSAADFLSVTPFGFIGLGVDPSGSGQAATGLRLLKVMPLIFGGQTIDTVAKARAT